MSADFIDEATIWLHAGKGGDGAVSFHHEKFVAAGGPDGGDGGRGGNIVFTADRNLSTLLDFRYKRKYNAEEGQDGRGSCQKGADGKDLVLRVPYGTVIRDFDTGLVIADIADDAPVLLAKGGRGGFGNKHFATPTRQLPRFAKPGLPGQDLHVTLELKIMADVGLIGFPNVGKSTLLSVISAARPKIANYHFTTLSPVLGVVRADPEHSFVCADIPGLIEGAAEGAGLGHDFLRHIERCRLLVHIVDVSATEGRDPIEDFEKINRELFKFNPDFAARPQIAVAGKCDMATESQISAFETYVEAHGYPCLALSAVSHKGIDELIHLIWQRLQSLPPIKKYESEYQIPDYPDMDRRHYEITRLDEHTFRIDAPWLERILAGSNVNDYESLQYFQTQLREAGILEDLVSAGVSENDTILIGDYEFDYVF